MSLFSLLESLIYDAHKKQKTHNAMLLNLNGEILINPIDQTPIKDNWKEYIKFRKNTHLWNFTKQELLERIRARKRQSKSIINSAILIGRFLRELSVNENFNQQIKAAFLKLDSQSLLGMQLYILLHEDDKKWTLMMPEGAGALFANANYIISSE